MVNSILNETFATRYAPQRCCQTRVRPEIFLSKLKFLSHSAKGLMGLNRAVRRPAVKSVEWWPCNNRVWCACFDVVSRQSDLWGWTTTILATLKSWQSRYELSLLITGLSALLTDDRAHLSLFKYIQLLSRVLLPEKCRWYAMHLRYFFIVSIEYFTWCRNEHGKILI